MTKNDISLKDAIAGYIIDAEARMLSPHTISDYRNTFTKLLTHISPSTPLRKIKPADIKAFIHALSEKTAAPAGCAPRPARKLSKKTILNHHTALCALWTWAAAPENGFVKDNIMQQVPRPKPEKRAIQPLTESDIQALLDVCETAKAYQHHRKQDQKPTQPTRNTGLRDRAIILLLLDTGLRASELCGLHVADVDLKNNRLLGIGKGDKERSIPFSPVTAKAIWRYKLHRQERAGSELTPDDLLFLSVYGDPLTRNALGRVLRSLGERAGITNVHPHRFRHTFAIMYLRNTGDLFTLQMLMGHESLETVQTYTRIAQADAERAHKTASPVANLKIR